jgi:regulator of replication initiation timing
MIRKRFTATGGAVALAAVLALAGCDRPSAGTVNTATGRTETPEAVASERDSLLAIVASNTRLMSEISSELAKVREVRRPMTAVVSPESPSGTVSYRDSLLATLKGVVQRVNDAEQRLAASQRRIRNLTVQSDSAKSQIALMEQTVGDLQATLENQRTTLTSMTDEINRMKVENEQLQVRTVALSDTVEQLSTQSSTVFYVIGTKDELKEKGVVVEEGSKFLIFGGKSLAPARNLPREVFTEIDMRQVNEIPLPNPEKEYKIVSRQNLEALGTPATRDGKVQGNLQISQPGQFWGPSRYLIIVEG